MCCFTASHYCLLSFPTKVNILIDKTGHACLADFGLLSIILDPKYLLSSSSHTQGGTARWMSPERIAPQRFGLKNSCPTTASDCYALGMVIYETISGNIPFHKDTDLAVFMKVVEGEHPPQGVRFTECLWKMMELCWAPQPNDRPSIKDILQHLEMDSSLLELPSPWIGEGMDDGSNGDDWDSETDFSGGDSLDSVASTTIPTIQLSHSDLHMVEQNTYQCTTRGQHWDPLPSINFKVQDMEGINLTDAMNLRFNGLDNCDDPVFTHDCIGGSISCRISVCGLCDGTPIVTKSSFD